MMVIKIKGKSSSLSIFKPYAAPDYLLYYDNCHTFFSNQNDNINESLPPPPLDEHAFSYDIYSMGRILEHVLNMESEGAQQLVTKMCAGTDRPSIQQCITDFQNLKDQDFSLNSPQQTLDLTDFENLHGFAGNQGYQTEINIIFN